MINKEKFRVVLESAEAGNAESIAVIRETLRPVKGDTVEQIAEKIKYYIRIIFHGSLKYPDAPFHTEIDYKFAEQVHSFINLGVPRYKVMLFIGFRESAKTTRVKMNQSYLTVYLEGLIDYANIMSADGNGSIQFTMDMFNIFAFSKLARYFPGIISETFSRGKKESQTMSKFTTVTGVTYAASSALKSKRGAAQTNIDDSGEISVKRPKQLLLDDIENENTINSYAITQNIRNVVNAAIDGLDQLSGFTVCTANYLSLRGNINYLLTKYRDLESACVVMIPIHDSLGDPTWKGKYAKTDVEVREFANQGIIKASIEAIRRDSDNFETEFLNNPKRNRVYFDDNVLSHINEEKLMPESSRDRSDGLGGVYPEGQGILIIEHPTPHDVYEMSVDAAGGMGGDQSAFTIYKTTGSKYVEVANFKCNSMKPEAFAPFSVNYARLYNNARIAPERNYPGNEYIAFAKAIYNNFYFEDKDKDLIGVHTNLKTKPEMFLKFKKYLLQDILEIRSQAMYNQIMEYPASDVETISQDESGGHFDLLMSAVVGIYKVQAAIQVEEEDPEMNKSIKEVVDSVFQESTSVR